MKKLIQFVLLLAILGLAYLLYRQFAKPMEFDQIRKQRESEVVSRLKDIRAAQRAYRQVYQKFTPSMDSLILFVQNDSLTYERQIGSLDDSLALTQGRVARIQFKMAVRDTIFSGRNLTNTEIEQFRIIPYSDNVPFIMDAGTLETMSGVVVQVFEAKAPYKDFLEIEGFHQNLVNLIDERKGLNRYPGLKVGSMTEATNEAGNWE
ncbi:MAG: type IV pilin-like G/H family protein [Rikenellaceae bacterium]|nr:type IV pilin-like G/H family protein [Rikenellaceae bacterium]